MASVAERVEARIGLEDLLGVALGQEPRPHHHVGIAEALDQRLRLRRDDRVDAADLVADLPAHLEERYRSRHFASLRAKSSITFMNAMNASCGVAYGLK